ncbi:MAG: hypothetical protein HOC72_09370, partial [Rhodospirillaceae bacterium]|nr:hypothetical protein [Rhodospirillaceae bacterium]
NQEPALHAHVFPRYDTEPEETRLSPVWLYDWDAAPPFEETRDRPLMDALRRDLQKRGIAE